MVKKWGIVLVTLVMSTQLSAETVKDVLGTQGQQYLTIINGAHIQPFQEITRKKLNNKLNQDLSAVTPTELKDLATTLEDFASVVAPLLKQSKTSLSPEEFSHLVQQVKSQLEALAGREKKTPPLVKPRKKSASSSNPMVNQISEADRMPEMLVTYGADLDNLDQDTRLNALMLNVSALNQMNKDGESSSDVDIEAIFEEYKDIFQQLIEDNESSREEGISDEENCRELLQLFFNHLGLAIDDYDGVLPAFTNALVSLQNEMSTGLALPIHHSLQQLPPVPAIVITPANTENTVTQTTANAHTNALNTELESMLNKYARQQSYDFSLLGDLGKVANDDTEALLAELTDDQLARLAADLEATELMAQPEEPNNDVAQFLAELAVEEIRDLEILRDNINGLQKLLKISQKSPETLTPQEAARLLKIQDRAEAIQEMFGEDEAAIRATLSNLLFDDEKVNMDALAQYIVTLLPSTKRTHTQDEGEIRKQRNKQRRAIKQGNVNIFIEYSRQNLESLIKQQWQENNGQLLDRNGCTQLLISFLNNLGLQPTDYRQMLPQLVEKLTILENEIRANQTPEQSGNEERKQLSKARRSIKQGNAATFIEHSRQPLESRIRQGWQENNGELLGEEKLGRLLVSFLSDLGLKATDYGNMLQDLRSRLVVMEIEMRNSQL